ncbi:MAG: 30S ribosomal protein S15 [Anaerolineae bacterium]|nr:30S ribosomal protein S15 [Anaerolineae bacterium]
MLSKEQKTQIIEEYGLSPDDTGSSQVQVALISSRITYLTEHLRANKGDMSSRRGLLKLVGQRRRHLNYLQKKDPQAYRDLIQRLGLRR